MAEASLLQQAQEAAKAREYERALELFNQVSGHGQPAHMPFCRNGRLLAAEPSAPVARCQRHGAAQQPGAPPARLLCSLTHLAPLPQAVDAEPTAEALAGRASVNNKLKNFMEAAADASRALELDDKLAAAHKEKGCDSGQAPPPLPCCHPALPPLTGCVPRRPPALPGPAQARLLCAGGV